MLALTIFPPAKAVGVGGKAVSMGVKAGKGAAAKNGFAAIAKTPEVFKGINVVSTQKVQKAFKQVYNDVVVAPFSATRQWIANTAKAMGDIRIPSLGHVPATAGGPAFNQTTVREAFSGAKESIVKMAVETEDRWKGFVDKGKGTGKDYKNYKDVEYTGTTKVNGEVRDISRRVFQRLDIDYKGVDPDTGLTNFQLMKKGRSPIWKDGSVIELHHLIQREPGSMVEIPASMHDEYNKILHGLVENGGSFRNDPVLKKQYDNFRGKYWRWRAKQIDKSEL